MPAPSSKIVITGIGVVSPLGIGVDDFHNSLESQRSVVQANSTPGLVNLPHSNHSLIEGFEPKKLVKPRKSIKLMCREVLTGVAASQLAVDHAQLDTAAIDSERFGVVLGSEMMYGDPRELIDLYLAAAPKGDFSLKRFGDSLQQLFPLWMLKYLPNMPACHVGIAHNSLGPNNSIVQGDASSLLALIEAVTLLRRGWVDVMIAGGTGSKILPAQAVNFDESKYSSQSPDIASRPFDKDRDGMVCGEGAASLVLETAEHAQARGARPLAEIVGIGRCFEIAKLNAMGEENSPSQQAIQRSIRLAITDADSSAEQMDHVNAHGQSSVENDRLEAQAIHAELGDVPVTAIKSYCGNLGAGCGAMEMAASVLAFDKGSLAPTLNYKTPDPNCPVNVVHGESKPVTKSDATILSQSSTGQAAAIVIRRVS